MVTLQGPLLPGMDRGARLEAWPRARPLAAELYPGLLGTDLELWDPAGRRLGVIQDFDLYVNDDPTGTLADVAHPDEKALRVVGVVHDRGENRGKCVWEAHIDTDGHVTTARDLQVRRGYGEPGSLAALLEENPPTIYFLDGTTVIGHLRYDSRLRASAFDPSRLEPVDWSGTDITAETPKIAARKKAGRSVHERLADYLLSRPRAGTARWIMCNDGAGEVRRREPARVAGPAAYPQGPQPRQVGQVLHAAQGAAEVQLLQGSGVQQVAGHRVQRRPGQAEAAQRRQPRRQAGEGDEGRTAAGAA